MSMKKNLTCALTLSLFLHLPDTSSACFFSCFKGKNDGEEHEKHRKQKNKPTEKSHLLQSESESSLVPYKPPSTNLDNVEFVKDLARYVAQGSMSCARPHKLDSSSFMIVFPGENQSVLILQGIQNSEKNEVRSPIEETYFLNKNVKPLSPEDKTQIMISPTRLLQNNVRDKVSHPDAADLSKQYCGMFGALLGKPGEVFVMTGEKRDWRAVRVNISEVGVISMVSGFSTVDTIQAIVGQMGGQTAIGFL